MGSGKTTFGKKLASAMQVPFIDLDHVFEKQEGCTIADYFARFGEADFRREEAAVLRTTDFPEDAVISTGGGTPCFHENMDWMNANGRTVYLMLPVKTLAQRLMPSLHTRPLLAGKSEDELEDFIREKLEEREAFYDLAELRVPGINLTPAALQDMLAGQRR